MTGSPHPTFADELESALSRQDLKPRRLARGECTTAAGSRCGLCLAGHVTYDRELSPRAEALKRFWSASIPDVPLSDLVPSPSGRDYRFVSKRKAFRQGRTVRLGLIDPDERETGGFISVGRCAIEPPLHAAIYAAAENLLGAPDAAAVAAVIRYVVIKGDEKECLVLLTVRSMQPDAVRSAGAFSKRLTRRVPGVKSVLLYEDTTSGRYYLGSERGRAPAVRKVFGRDTLMVRVEGRPFVFGPLTFTQVNRGMIEALVRGARAMLALRPEQTLFDLYCGYGLFALSLAGNVRAAVGVESARDAVGAARENAARQHARSVRFIQSEISGETIGKLMRAASPGDAVLLDPPRKGTAPGVLEGIAARAPSRVVHIFCNIDGIRGELKRWASCGYAARQAIPYDLFPGTSSIEVMVLLTPAA
jgi:tRNA/tmRNA/rRNA uracil-C5-methylase (TrmA/RlmC/RlmD family)